MADLVIRGTALRAVLFDVDGTLYRQGPVRRAMMRRLAGTYWKRPRSGGRVARALAAYRRAQETLRSNGFTGDVTEAQTRMAADRSGTDPTDVRAWVDQWMETAPLDVVGASGRDGLGEALDALTARGVKLAAVSDYPARRKLAALGIAERFEAVVSAQDRRVDAFKPNPRGLEVALDDLGVDAAQAVFVGDRDDVDAAAAAAAGMRCVLVGSHRASAPSPDVRHVERFADLMEVLESW